MAANANSEAACPLGGPPAAGNERMRSPIGPVDMDGACKISHGLGFLLG